MTDETNRTTHRIVIGNGLIIYFSYNVKFSGANLNNNNVEKDSLNIKNYFNPKRYRWFASTAMHGYVLIEFLSTKVI